MAAANESGWDVSGALLALRGRMDPYIWDQGQELYQRGAAADFAMLQDGSIQVKVLDPRDARHFFVKLSRKHADVVLSHCPCPYRLAGVCRHQVVALEYLRAISDGSAESGGASGDDTTPASGDQTRAGVPGEAGIATLYRLSESIDSVTTAPDGSLLRVVLFELGSAQKAHRVGLQLYTGTGWTEVRTTDVDRWIGRGSDGPHPRDVFLARSFTTDGTLRKELDSETLSAILRAIQSSEALVERGGRGLKVSPWPRSLAARLVSGADSSADDSTLGVEFTCRAADGSAVPFDEVSLVPSVAPWIQLEDGSFCPLISGAPGPLLEELQWVDFTTIPAAELDRFLAQGVRQLEQLCPGTFETAPDLIRDVEGVDAARLVLAGSPARLAGRLELSYGGHWVVAPETPEPWTVTIEGKLHRYPPAGQSMARARRELDAIGFVREDADWVLQGDGVLRSLLEREDEFVQIGLPEQLTQFDLVKRPPQLVLRVGGEGFTGGGREVGAEGSGGGERRGGSGMAWFQVDYELVDGDRVLSVDLPQLVSASEEFHQGSAPGSLVELEDGSVLDVRHESVADLVNLAGSARAAGGGAPGPGGLRLPLALAGELSTVGATWSLEVAPQVRSFFDGLDGEAPGVPLSTETEELLRPYQRVAVDWLDHLGNYGLGGVLADEMGLGKTVMSLSHFFGHDDDLPAAKGQAPILIVCPTSLGFNWRDECARFFPAAKVVNLCGQPPNLRRELLTGDADLLVTSYGLLRRDREWLEAREFRAVLLDEAQHIKNAESQTAQAAYALRADERWGLTGTPVENHLGDLWSIFHFALPGLLGEAEDFQTRFAEAIRHGEEGVVERLRARISPFFLRRKKEEVLADLPPRIDQLERVPMTDGQRQVYDAILAKVRGELETADPASSRFQVLAALTRLRQVCCHPRLVLNEDEKGGGAENGAPSGFSSENLTGGKFELLKELLEECLEEGHRVLLFSQFTKMLDIIEEDLEARGIERCRLDGSTRDREGVVRRFRESDSIPVFLISLKAGGFGLNLTEADTVILYDPWWNPATEDQAASRAHRMGQTVPVHVHKLITVGTVEEKILELQATKRELAKSVIASDEEAISRLGTDALRDLILG